MKGRSTSRRSARRAWASTAALCARSLARAHARSGDSIAIAAYLGTSDTFDGAIADFSEAYADQNERDYAAFTKAIADGKVESAPG